jgi:hypothetical protein
MDREIADRHAEPIGSDGAHGGRQRRDLVVRFCGLQPREDGTGRQHRAQWMVGGQRRRVDQLGGAAQLRCLVGEIRHPDHLDQHPGSLFSITAGHRLGACQHHLRRMPRCAALEFQSGPDPGQPGQRPRVVCQGRRLVRQGGGAVQLTGVARAHRGGGQAVAAHAAIGGQPCRPLVRRRAGRISTAPVGPQRGGFHRLCGLFVESFRGGCEMPGTPIVVLGQLIGERTMNRNPIRRRRALIDSRADQRVPERDDIVTDVDQPRTLGGFEIFELQPYSMPRRENRAEVTGSLRCRQEQDQPGGRRQPIHPRAECVEYPVRGGRRRGDGRSASACGSGEFDERQRVSAGFFDQPVAHM